MVAKSNHSERCHVVSVYKSPSQAFPFCFTAASTISCATSLKNWQKRMMQAAYHTWVWQNLVLWPYGLCGEGIINRRQHNDPKRT